MLGTVNFAIWPCLVRHAKGLAKVIRLATLITSFNTLILAESLALWLVFIAAVWALNIIIIAYIIKVAHFIISD
jgi:hypothetical protein